MGLTIKRFDHVGLPTEMFDRMRAFCEQVLELTPAPTLATGYGKYRLAWYRDEQGIEYHVNQRIPDLPSQTGSDFNQSMYPHFAFEVESLEAAKEHLESLQFPFHELKGEGIAARKQLYVLLEEFGMMVELFEWRSDVEPTWRAPGETY
jgi:hypothetical protein